jgi:F0F1-type ATP synthase alpha subunit
MIESIAPSIISRSPVDTPLETGLKVVDSLFLLDMDNVN